MSTVTSPSPPGAHCVRGGPLAACVLPVWLLLSPTPGEAAPGFRAELAALGGVVQPDPELADFQWDATARPALAVEATAGTGFAAGGLRVSSWSTVQESADARVRVDALELRARVRAFRAGRLSCLGLLGLGRVRVGYRPDTVLVENPGGDPIPVSLDPVHAWTFGFGVALEHPLSRRLVAGAELERSAFSLDAAHRDGEAIVVESTSFESLLVRLRLSYSLWSS